MTFNTLGLDDALLRAVAGQGYTQPTPIQQKAIPSVLAGRDVLASAQTGTGKTAGFTLPLLQRLAATAHKHKSNAPRALVLSPTRELAAQVGESVTTYGRHLPLRCSVIYGGVKIGPQFKSLREGVDIVVATPGRLLDHVSQGTLDLSSIEILVLDEADRMLDMGFIHDIRRIIKQVPKVRQTLMFSATFSNDIRRLADGLLHNPEKLDVAPRNTTVERINQLVRPVAKEHKRALLSWLISSNDWHQVLVFTRTKHGANRLSQQLERDGLCSAAIHGNKTQGARTRALAGFKSGEIQVLVATDIAARGLDIERLPHVVNFELPNVPEDYVHRIGRTGRAGLDGEAVSLVSAEEKSLLRDIEKLLGEKIPSKTDHDIGQILAVAPKAHPPRESAIKVNQEPGAKRRSRSTRGQKSTKTQKTTRARDGAPRRRTRAEVPAILGG
jgi:ATP-dependent RNA helicase RhlE